MIAIKNWFLEKNNMRGLRGVTFTIAKETEKAALLRYDLGFGTKEAWFPKSVIIDEWEKDTSNLGYHEYVESECHKAYEQGHLFEQGTFKSGRNIYRNDNFLYQYKTKELIALLDKYHVSYLTREQWNNR